ncbi:hypothetical protein BHM03_00060028 [Ensete ventricosum]|uniref:Uncharacterized protein n=1 Tax=Ensete ventricosum TaxID=4639 RepID=A0A445MMP9_ENSVE|nr:hypothetical protein BHM03_00060028 [Ensete ventricosum]
MATNTPSSVYKPLHEYRILRVSNSPHLYEFCITLSVIEQHIPLCTVSSFTKRLACLEHYQVWLSTSVILMGIARIGQTARYWAVPPIGVIFAQFRPSPPAVKRYQLREKEEEGEFGDPSPLSLDERK